MRKTLACISLFAVAAFFSSCAAKTIKLPTADPQEPGDVVLLTTTDFHSSFDRAEGLYNEIKKLRSKFGARSLYLDGGDLFQGSLEGNLNKGRAMVDFYNLLGVEAAAMGNHELDYGPDVPGRSAVLPGEDGLGNLRSRLKTANFEWLSANFVYDGVKCDPAKEEYCNALGEKTMFKPRSEFRKNGNLVCVLGATTPSTPHITNQNFIKGMRFDELLPVVNAEIDYAKKTRHCDFTVLIAHAGLECDKTEHCQEPGDLAEVLRLSQALPNSSLSAIVAGHTHLRAREIINGMPIIEAGCYGKQIGVLHLYKGKQPRFEQWVSVAENAKAPEVTKMMHPYREEAQVLKSRVVGKATAPFVRNYLAETAMGNMLASMLLDVGRKKLGAQFALLNAGGIRNDFPQGTITYGHVFQVMPFDNSLAIAELKGSELKRLIEIVYSGANGMPPSAGFKIKRIEAASSMQGPWDRDLDGDGKKEVWERNLLKEITTSDGHPIEDEKMYKLATIDFLTNGAERQDFIYKKIPPSHIHVYTGTWVRDAFEEWLRNKKVIRPEQFYDPKNPRIENVAP